MPVQSLPTPHPRTARPAILFGALLAACLACACDSSLGGSDDSADGDANSASADADQSRDGNTLSDAGASVDAETETCDDIRGVGEPLAVRSECGTLWYGLYANQDQDDAIHRLPDYSYAGYRRGGVTIPDVPVAATVSPGSGDDRARIQDAIDTVSAMAPDAEGHRGAVLLLAGTYEVGDTLEIQAGGVVLRGEGQGSDGTILVATRAEQHDFIVVRGSGTGLGEVEGTRTDITSSVVPVGSKSFAVASASGFSVGDLVGVLRTPNQSWIDELDMGQWGWTTSSYTIGHVRRIAAIEGDTITVDIPLVDTMEDQYGGGALFRADLSGRIAEVGVEDLRLVSEYDGAEDEAHGWSAVVLRRATNSWVRRVTAVHFGYAAVSINEESSFNTVEECAHLEPVSIITGGRRYSFNLSDGIGNLFQRCYSEESRHDFVSGARTTGPNVWLDCYSRASNADDGPHHRWATGLLYDNLSSLEQHVENREDSGTGHGWSGAQTLFWNGIAEGIRCDAPRGAMNWTVGCMGEKQEGGWAPEEPFGWWESYGAPVEPRSLYLQQLQDRLGREAVDAITTPAQRTGRIWGQLAAWAGEGRLEDYPTSPSAGDPTCATGVASGISCCAASCGTCGGDGCSGRPGGADACCTGHIKVSGKSCQVSGPPCILDPPFDPIGDLP